jgi:hypothetical protein
MVKGGVVIYVLQADLYFQPDRARPASFAFPHADVIDKCVTVAVRENKFHCIITANATKPLDFGY